MAFGQILGTNFINLSLLPLGDLIFSGEPVLSVLGAFETVSALLGAFLIGIFMVALLEHRNRTIFKMGVVSAGVIAVFVEGVAMLAGLRSGERPAGKECVGTCVSGRSPAREEDRKRVG